METERKCKENREERREGEEDIDLVASSELSRRIEFWAKFVGENAFREHLEILNKKRSNVRKEETQRIHLNDDPGRLFLLILSKCHGHFSVPHFDIFRHHLMISWNAIDTLCAQT